MGSVRVPAALAVAVAIRGRRGARLLRKALPELLRIRALTMRALVAPLSVLGVVRIGTRPTMRSARRWARLVLMVLRIGDLRIVLRARGPVALLILGNVRAGVRHGGWVGSLCKGRKGTRFCLGRLIPRGQEKDRVDELLDIWRHGSGGPPWTRPDSTMQTVTKVTMKD
ncbi:hypothetical protein GCM10009733_061620 [Nonomuraea maheshkhaliensis]|uniref:Uncharacterized protein n=1 Tax=Nonomuraea maheshkhaliensis TaxID=419590 RepID=A0ABN2FQ91_9ACTN